MNMTTTYFYADEPVYPLECVKIMTLGKDNGIKPLYRKKCMTHGVSTLYWNTESESIKTKHPERVHVSKCR